MISAEVSNSRLDTLNHWLKSKDFGKDFYEARN